MNAIRLATCGSLLDHAEEIDRPDLPALEGDLDTVGRRGRRHRAAERRAARQLADHLQRLDLQRACDLAGGIATGDENTADVRRLDHVPNPLAERGARASVSRVDDGAAAA